jgi:hypothetical protein
MTIARIHNPHPGEVLQVTLRRADGGVTVTAFAKRLNTSSVGRSHVRGSR